MATTIFPSPSYSTRSLQKLLLQPRGMQTTERINKTNGQTLPLKVRKLVGKVRVEGITQERLFMLNF